MDVGEIHVQPRHVMILVFLVAVGVTSVIYRTLPSPTQPNPNVPIGEVTIHTLAGGKVPEIEITTKAVGETYTREYVFHNTAAGRQKALLKVYPASMNIDVTLSSPNPFWLDAESNATVVLTITPLDEAAVTTYQVILLVTTG